MSLRSAFSVRGAKSSQLGRVSGGGGGGGGYDFEAMLATPVKNSKKRELNNFLSAPVDPLGSYLTELKDSSEKSNFQKGVGVGALGTTAGRQGPVQPLLLHINRSESDDYYESQYSARFRNSLWSCIYRCVFGESVLTPDGMVKQEGTGFCGCLDYISSEVHVILLLYIVNKTGQELAVSSIPSVTQTLFQWNNEWQGYYMALMGAMVLPSNIVVNKLVKDIEDREMVLKLSLVCVGSSLAMLQTNFTKYSFVQYVIGNSLLFSALNSMEGIIMSLVSGSRPSSIAFDVVSSCIYCCSWRN
jgi:hypothetical protein